MWQASISVWALVLFFSTYTTGNAEYSQPITTGNEDIQAIANEVAKEVNNPDITPQIIMALLDRESNLGAGLDSEGKGDNGHGCGIAQIDYRYHKDFLRDINCKEDNRKIIEYGVKKVLLPAVEEFGIKGGLAAYNAGITPVKKAITSGKDPDSVTTGKNYAADVLARASKF